MLELAPTYGVAFKHLRWGTFIIDEQRMPSVFDASASRRVIPARSIGELEMC